jgi:hypothetical protein
MNKIVGPAGPVAFVRSHDDAMQASPSNAAEHYCQRLSFFERPTGDKSFSQIGRERLKKTQGMGRYTEPLHRPEIEIVKRWTDCVDTTTNLATHSRFRCISNGVTGLLRQAVLPKVFFLRSLKANFAIELEYGTDAVFGSAQIVSSHSPTNDDAIALPDLCNLDQPLRQGRKVFPREIAAERSSVLYEGLRKQNPTATLDQH